MAARLKVFVTSDGLTDYVVATSSRAKALAAWGVHQDIFKSGEARQSDDPKLTAAALAKPGEVLRRAAGSREALARAKPKRAPKPAGPPKRLLARIRALAEKLAALGAEDQRGQEAFEAARARLEAQESARREGLEARRGRAEA